MKLQFTVINDKNDWENYIANLDKEGRYRFRHIDEPEMYPCAVYSEFWDDPNGPYTYNHKFVYTKTVVDTKTQEIRTEWDI